jgi:hypothetical protein
MGRWIAAIVFERAAVLESREWRVDRVEREKEDLVVGTVRGVRCKPTPTLVFLLSTFSPRLSIRRRRIGVIGFEPKSNSDLTAFPNESCEISQTSGAANALQIGCTSCPKQATTDPQLQTIIAAWPSLSDQAKLQILGVLAADFVRRIPSQ